MYTADDIPGGMSSDILAPCLEWSQEAALFYVVLCEGCVDKLELVGPSGPQLCICSFRGSVLKLLRTLTPVQLVTWACL